MPTGHRLTSSREDSRVLYLSWVYWTFNSVAITIWLSAYCQRAHGTGWLHRERTAESQNFELRIATLILFVLGLSDCQHILYFLWISSLWNNVEFGLFRHLNSFFILTNGLNLRTRRRLIRKWCQAVVASCVVLLMCMGRGREGETRQTNEHSKWKLTTNQPNQH